jgi:hypothetical protein
MSGGLALGKLMRVHKRLDRRLRSAPGRNASDPGRGWGRRPGRAPIPWPQLGHEDLAPATQRRSLGHPSWVHKVVALRCDDVERAVTTKSQAAKGLTAVGGGLMGRIISDLMQYAF